MPHAKQQLKELYVALMDHPLDPFEDDKNLYEPFVESNPDGDPVEELITAIEFSGVESLHLISGQRGTGKSTELKRFKGMIAKRGYEVFYLDILEYLSASEAVEITDFLLVVSAGLAELVKDEFGFDELYESYWERMQELVNSKLELDAFKVRMPLGEFAVEFQAHLKRDTSFKKKLQQAARNHIVALTDQVNDFMRNVVKKIREERDKDDLQVVFIVDSFEQIRGTSQNASEVHDAMVNLFGRHGEALHLPWIHFVITVPPYLSTAAPGITALTQCNAIINFPTLHVHLRENEEDHHTLEIMRSVVRRRSRYTDNIFSDQQINHLALASGGDFRHFFAMLRTAILKAGAGLTASLPIKEQQIDQAEETQRRSMLPISDEDVEWLSKVHQSKKVELSRTEQLPLLARLFDSGLILNYRNGDDWYDIHPLVLGYVKERQQTLQQRHNE